MSNIIPIKQIPRTAKQWRKALSRRAQDDIGATTPPPDLDISDIPQSEILQLARFIYQLWTESPKIKLTPNYAFIGSSTVLPRSKFDAGEAFAATIIKAADKAGRDRIEFLKELIDKSA